MTTPALQQHPLATLVERTNLTAAAYLTRVACHHRDLGFGHMATRKEKLSRWLHGTTPERTAQLAIARLHRIDTAAIDRLGWPGCLLLAIDDDHTVLEAPWTPAGTVEALTDAGGNVDRRGFLIATAGTLTATLAQWATAAPAIAVHGRTRRVGTDAVDLIDTRLAALRHLDDTVGAGHVYDAALLELRLITDLIDRASYSTSTGQRLFGCAAEAARLAGWCAYDAGRYAASERHFVTALRAAGSAEDTTLGALIIGFWANLRYNAGEPRSALHLVEGALAQRRALSSPRVRAMLHARAARAHSILGESAPAWRQVDAAFTAYATAPRVEHDAAAVYWVNHGELCHVAASSALSLGQPHRALEHFTAACTHTDPYDADREVRGTAIYLARRAEAHLALSEVDAALEAGHQAIRLLGGIDSARTSSALADLRGELGGYRSVPAVSEFLDFTT